jgi:hypothetical protein
MGRNKIGGKMKNKKSVMYARRRGGGWRKVWASLTGLCLLAALNVAHADQPTIGRQKSSDDYEKASQDNLALLSGRLGKTREAFERSLQKAYPAYQLIEACEGSFKQVGVRDFVLGLHQPKTNRNVYAAFVMEPDGRYAVHELLGFQADEGKGVTVECYSSTGIQRVRADYMGIKLFTDPGAPAFNDIGLRGALDVACVMPPGDYEFICYGYEPKKKKFGEVAAWSNDWVPEEKAEPGVKRK